MDTSKRGYIPMQERLDLNKTQGASTPEDVKRMQNVPYASVVGSIMYAKSTKQSTTAMSATEAEYIAALEAAMKLFGLGAVLLISNEPRVQKGAIDYHKRYHYVRECIELGDINLRKVRTADNLADPFTKALSKVKLTQHARIMGLRLAGSFM
ncbi:hypothetical protein Tco_1004360 [Tanacetum coccineum]|uniref:Reverse transcriptase Ty1/copia-type domain-containing protein n=1 Tax=Tanacetum coccineum TaxID=301880 RepID=A0ABQ5FC70_9ASTR